VFNFHPIYRSKCRSSGIMLARNLVCSSMGTIDGAAGGCLGCSRVRCYFLFHSQPYRGMVGGISIVDGDLLVVDE